MDRPTNMLHLCILLLIVPFGPGFGCAGGSGTGHDDPGDACDSICEAIDDCDPELTDDEACEDMCDGIKAIEDEISAGCKDAIADLMNCAADLSCEILELDDESEDPHYLDNIFDDCAPEEDEVRDACRGELDEDDDDDD